MPAHDNTFAASFSNEAPLDPVTVAYARFLMIVSANRPRPQRAENTLAALEDRVNDVQAQIIACADWLAALVEDTAQHLPMSGRQDDVVKATCMDLASDFRAVLHDLAGDTVGPMHRAVDEIRDDRGMK